MLAHGVTTHRLPPSSTAWPRPARSGRALSCGASRPAAPRSPTPSSGWRAAFPETEIRWSGSTEAEPVAHSAEALGGPTGRPRPRATAGRPASGSGASSSARRAVALGPGLGGWEVAPGEIGSRSFPGARGADYHPTQGGRRNKIVETNGAGETVWHGWGTPAPSTRRVGWRRPGALDHPALRPEGEGDPPQLVEQAAGAATHPAGAVVGLPDGRGARPRPLPGAAGDFAGAELNRGLSDFRAGRRWTRSCDPGPLRSTPAQQQDRLWSAARAAAPRGNSLVRGGQAMSTAPRAPARSVGPLPRLLGLPPRALPALRHEVSSPSPRTSSGASLTDPGAPHALRPLDPARRLTLLGFFFHLRVFDEHKDYARTSAHRIGSSERPVTLRHLKILGALAIVLKSSAPRCAAPAPLAAWALAFAFSLLMLQGSSPGVAEGALPALCHPHLVVMPLLSLLVFSFATGRTTPGAPTWFWLYAGSASSSLRWEVSRRSAPGDRDRRGRDLPRLRHLRRRLPGARHPRGRHAAGGGRRLAPGARTLVLRRPHFALFQRSAWYGFFQFRSTPTARQRSGWSSTPACTSSPSTSSWPWPSPAAWGSPCEGARRAARRGGAGRGGRRQGRQPGPAGAPRPPRPPLVRPLHRRLPRPSGSGPQIAARPRGSISRSVRRGIRAWILGTPLPRPGGGDRAGARERGGVRCRPSLGGGETRRGSRSPACATASSSCAGPECSMPCAGSGFGLLSGPRLPPGQGDPLRRIAVGSWSSG
jgi:hypothetical protein